MKTLFVNRTVIVSIFVVMLLTYSIQGISYAQEAPDTIVEFADLNLAKAVRSTLGLGTTGGRIPLLKIPKAELTRLTYLKYNNDRYWETPIEQKISNLRGLEHATHLRELSLDGNNLSNLSPLAGWTQLVKLDISRNKIRDLTPLGSLTQLIYLNISYNSIEDFTPLAEFKNLIRLRLFGYDISDLSSVPALLDQTEIHISGYDDPLTEVHTLI